MLWCKTAFLLSDGLLIVNLCLQDLLARGDKPHVSQRLGHRFCSVYPALSGHHWSAAECPGHRQDNGVRIHFMSIRQTVYLCLKLVVSTLQGGPITHYSNTFRGGHAWPEGNEVKSVLFMWETSNKTQDIPFRKIYSVKKEMATLEHLIQLVLLMLGRDYII